MVRYLRKQTNKKKFSIAIPGDTCLLLRIAQQKGFFDDHKLKLKFHVMYTGLKGMEMLLEDKVDVAVLVETNVAYLGYLKPKIPVKCFASIETRTADNILLRHKPDIKATPQDLKGKVVGFMPRTTSHGFLMKFLEHHGIDKNDIELKTISPQAMPNALIRGEVDAISCWQPYTHNTVLSMNELGQSYSLFRNTGFFVSEVVLAARKPFLVKNEESIKSLLRALRDAEKFVQEHSEEAAAILVEVLKLSGLGHREVLKQYNLAIAPIGDQYIGNLQAIAQWIRTKDTTFHDHPIPDYTDYIETEKFLDYLHK